MCGACQIKRAYRLRTADDKISSNQPYILLLILHVLLLTFLHLFCRAVCALVENKQTCCRPANSRSASGWAARVYIEKEIWKKSRSQIFDTRPPQPPGGKAKVGVLLQFIRARFTLIVTSAVNSVTTLK